MRRELSPEMERGRFFDPELRYDAGSGPQGDFNVAGPLGMRLRIVASDGRDWAECGLPLPAWEHVSVSLKTRCPVWREMEWVREQFWEDDATVLQFSVPRAAHLNAHPYCLHLWRAIGVPVLLPPPMTVAPAPAESSSAPMPPRQGIGTTHGEAAP